MFKENHRSILYSFHPVNVMKVEQSNVAIARGGRAKIYEYSEQLARWVEKEELRPYYVFEDKYIAVI